MGNSTTSLMLQEEEITGIVAETGCKIFELLFNSIKIIKDLIFKF